MTSEQAAFRVEAVHGSGRSIRPMDRVWVGPQMSRAQAEEAWRALGSPEGKEPLVARLLSLTPGEAVLRDTNGRISILRLHLPARICIEEDLGEVIVMQESESRAGFDV